MATARRSWVADFAWWAENYCVQSVDRFAGEPLELEDWQLAFMGEALEVDEEELPRWRSALLVLPRKNGKTTLLASFALYHLLNSPGSPEVLLAASSDKQAGRLFDGVSSFVRRSPELDAQVHIRDYIGEIARVDGAGKILRVASSPERLHGYNPSLVIVDELAQWTTPNLRKAWGALTTGGGARRGAQTFSITTAGAAQDRGEGILGQLIDGNEELGEVERPHDALTVSRNEEGRTLVYSYSAPTSSRHDVPAIKRANPASWVTEEFLARQAANPELSDADFLQLHGCVWTSSEDTFIHGPTWAELGDGGPIAPPRYASIGADGSRVHDTTVIAWASTAEDGRIDVDAKVYSVRREAPHHVFHAGGVIDYEDVEAGLLELFGRYSVREAAYDPRYLDRSADILRSRLREASIFPVEPGSGHARDAYAAFHRGILEGVVRHRGDPVLAAHVTAAVAEWDDRGPLCRKRSQSRPIDALVAMALAYWRESRRPKAGAWAASW